MKVDKKTPEKSAILVIEDEEDLRNIVLYNLRRHGFFARGVETGEAGLECVAAEQPDLIILDLMLPGIDGLEVCRRIKETKATQGIAIIIVSAKGEETDIVKGLELGADDYLPKPFSPRILMARVKAVLRRARHETAVQPGYIEIENLVIDDKKQQVKVSGTIVELTRSEFKILHFLACHRGWVYTRYQIVDAIRGENHDVTERAVDVRIVGLRKKLGTSAALIETVRGVGYRFKSLPYS